MHARSTADCGIHAAIWLLLLAHPILGVEGRTAASSRSAGILTSPTLLQWPIDAPEAADEADGQRAPIETDRPDFTEASSTVGRRVTQIETGYTLFRDDSEQTRHLRAQSFPELLLRQGLLADWFELRLGWSYSTESETISGVTGTTHGADDLYVGAKLALTKQSGALPEMALMPQMTVPVGGKFSAGRMLPGLNWLYSWQVTPLVAFGGSSQYNLSVDERTLKLHGEVSQSFTSNMALTDRQSVYVEWFSFIPSGAETEHTEHYANGGFTFAWTDDLQTDIRCGWGLSEHATDFFAGTGLAIRF